MSSQWISAEEAQARLGVKLQTLYAYVSRGQISARQDEAEARRSLYSAEDIGRLILRKQKRYATEVIPAGPIRGDSGPTVVTGQTLASGGVFRYRGRDVAELSETATFEDAARLLWACEEDSFSGLGPRPLMISGAEPRARMFALLSHRAAQDAAASGRGDNALKREAASVLADVVNAACGVSRSGALHDRLARFWRAEGSKADMIRRMLVLAADQEAEDASNYAARVTASTGASLAACALSGLSAFSGPQQGGGPARLAAFVAEARRASNPRQAALQRLGQGLEVPGFGAAQFPEGDPRARALAFALPWSDELSRIAEAGEAVTGQAPNFDFALVATCRTLGLPAEAPSALIAVARTAGWLGHALEQRANGGVIRPRVRYVAPVEERAAANDAAA